MKNNLVFLFGVLLAAWCLHDLTSDGSAGGLTAVINVVGALAGFTIAAGAIVIKVRARMPKS